MDLQGKRVALLVEDNYDDLEFWYPKLRLQEAGAEVVVVGTDSPTYRSKHGIAAEADVMAEYAQAEAFDAFVIPSGPSRETVAAHPALLELVNAAIQHRKVIAAIAPAGRVMVAAQDKSDEGVLRLFGLQEEVVRDGPYEDSAVIRQGNLITARPPVDLPAFCRMILAALAESTTPSNGHVTYG
jgi:protease I